LDTNKATYPGIFMDSNNGNQRESGEIKVNASCITFTSESQKVEFSFHLLQITNGGNNRELIFFAHPNKVGLTFYTTQKAILNESVFHEDPELKEQITILKSSRRIILIGTSIGFVIVISIIVSLFLLKKTFLEALANKAPIEWEAKIGDKLFESLKYQNEFIHNDSLEQEFLIAAKPLIDQVRKEGTKVEFYFIKQATINAFALPGGKVVIQTGLIDHANSWEEVLGVVGHELAHVTRRHHLRGVINNLGLYVIVSSLIGDVNSAAGAVINTGGDLASLSNDRAFETEADETGMNYLIASHIDPKGMISFFKTLKKESGSKMDDYSSFMSTHPATSDRIQHLNELLKNRKCIIKNVKGDFKAFKKHINQLK
jgi:predicted Zn-dependent protease